MIEFIENMDDGWRPEIAATNSDSLRRYSAALVHLSKQGFPPAILGAASPHQ
jgi:hypothetical protein